MREIKYRYLKTNSYWVPIREICYVLRLDKITKEIAEEFRLDLENYPFKPVVGLSNPQVVIYISVPIVYFS